MAKKKLKRKAQTDNVAVVSDKTDKKDQTVQVVGTDSSGSVVAPWRKQGKSSAQLWPGKGKGHKGSKGGKRSWTPQKGVKGKAGGKGKDAGKGFWWTPSVKDQLQLVQRSLGFWNRAGCG